MGAGDSLMFRAGVDTSGVKSGMQEAANDVANGSNKVRNSFNNADEAHDKLLGSSHRVARQLSSVTSSLLSGASAADVVSASMEGLERSLHLPLGALAGLAVGATIFEKMHSASEKIQELNSGIAEALHPTAGPDFSSLDELKKKIEDINAQQAKLNDSSYGAGLTREMSGIYENVGHVVAGTVLGAEGLITGNNGNISEARAHFSSIRNDEDDSSLIQGQTAELQKSKAQATKDIAAKENKKADIEETGQRGYELDYDKLKIEEKYAEAIGKADNISKAGSGSELREALERQKQLDLDAAQHKASVRTMDFEHESTALDIKASGQNVDVRGAAANLSHARHIAAEATNHGTESEEHAAELRVKSAEQEFQAAQRSEEIKAKQRNDAVEIANFTGSADEKHLLELKKQSQELQLQLKLAKPDQAKDIGVQIAQNASAQRDEMRRRVRESFTMEDLRIDATTGIGEGNHLDAMQAHLANARNQQRALNAPDSGASDLEKAQQAAHVKGLENSIAELNQSRGDAVDHARDQSDIMDQQLQGHQTLAERMRIEAEYADRIVDAQRAKNAGLVEQLQHQRDVALNQQAVDDFLKTPAQRRQERADARRRNRAAHTVQHQQDDATDRARRGAHGLHRLGDHVNGKDKPVAMLDPQAAQAIQQSIAAVSSMLGIFGLPLP